VLRRGTTMPIHRLFPAGLTPLLPPSFFLECGSPADSLRFDSASSSPHLHRSIKGSIG
jgi:hypothetical protein